jgi:hypothetical protein
MNALWKDMANLKLSDRGMIWNSDLVETLGEISCEKERYQEMVHTKLSAFLYVKRTICLAGQEWKKSVSESSTVPLKRRKLKFLFKQIPAKMRNIIFLVISQEYFFILRARIHHLKQCSGSIGSVSFFGPSGSVSQAPIWIRILPSSIINSKETLDFYFL